MEFFIRDKINNIITKTKQNKCYVTIKNNKFDQIDCFKIFMNSNDQSIFKIFGFTVSTFLTKQKDSEYMVFVFSTPINEKNNTKSVYDKISELVSSFEEILISLDYAFSKESTEEKQVYVTIVKKIVDEEN